MGSSLHHLAVFDDENLKLAADVAMSVSPGSNTEFPVKYNGHPFNELCLLWPSMRNKRLFKKGKDSFSGDRDLFQNKKNFDLKLL